MISARNKNFMGRYYWNKKEEVDGLLQIKVWVLKKFKFLSGGFASGTLNWTYQGGKSSVGVDVLTRGIDKHLKIKYTLTERDGTKKDFEYRIPIVTTPCHFGGERYWLICPAYKNNRICSKRVGVLYKSGDYFACRHCYNLTYSSRNLGGISKRAGQVISFPELEELEKQAKTKYYANKITKKYKRFLRKEKKSLYQMQLMAGYFER